MTFHAQTATPAADPGTPLPEVTEPGRPAVQDEDEAQALAPDGNDEGQADADEAKTNLD